MEPNQPDLWRCAPTGFLIWTSLSFQAIDLKLVSKRWEFRREGKTKVAPLCTLERICVAGLQEFANAVMF